MTITQARLKELLHYNPDTGIFTRRICHVRQRAGTVAGYDKGGGYLRVDIDGGKYYLHRLAWLYVHGVWPPEVIDHINGNPSDNRLCNLRAASQRLNTRNSRAKKNRSGKYKGITFQAGKWRAQIRGLDKKRIHLGYFGTEEAAHAAYIAKASELIGILCTSLSQ